MSGKLAEGAKIGLALQFGRKLSQIERVLKEMPHPADTTQADAVFADTLKENKVNTKNLGFDGDDITTESIEAFRKARGLRWEPCSDMKSLILVDKNGIPYVEGLGSVSEADDNMPEAAESKHGEVIERTKEEFEKNLEEFRGTEKVTYENQKMFVMLESGLRGSMENVLSDYTGHSIEHVQEVIEEGRKILDALEASGMVIPEKTKRAYSVAAKYHDIGMAESQGMNAAREIQEKLTNFDGNFEALAQYFNLDQNVEDADEIQRRFSEIKSSVEGDANRIKEVRRQGRLQVQMAHAKVLATQIREMAPDDPMRVQAIKKYTISLARMQSAVFGSLRANHAQKSAEYVLQYGQTDEFKERYGSDINPRNVACAIMLHTKTNSGCGDLNLLRKGQADDGKLSVEEASSRLIANWNQQHESFRVETTFSQEDLIEISELASVLRIADNRRDGETATFTSGDRVVCDASGEKVRVFHSKESEGKTIKDRELVSHESVRIISSEACTQFGKLRPEGKNLVHIIDFNGANSEQLEHAFVYARIVDYVSEVESGVLKSGRTPDDEVTGLHSFKGDNILEIRVDVKSHVELEQMQVKWQNWLTIGDGLSSLKTDKRAIAMEYGKPGRIRLVSKNGND